MIKYIYCSICGAKVEIYYDPITGHYKGECPVCHKWYEGYKSRNEDI